MLQEALKGWALVSGRDFVSEDDLALIAPFVLMHRLKFHGGAGKPEAALRELMAPHMERLVAGGLR